MLCRQCEQTVGGKACNMNMGVCGKDEKTAALQDLLVHVLKGIAVYADRAQQLGVKDSEADAFVAQALFATLTNVSFDPEVLKGLILKAAQIKDSIKQVFLHAYREKNQKDLTDTLPAVIEWNPADTLEGLIEQGRAVGLMAEPELNEDIRSLREIVLYGLKGMAAYADHARILGQTDETVNAFFYKALAALVDDSLGADELTALVLEVGTVNLRVMELLDAGNTGTYGHPEPTHVPVGVKKGPAIVISGHDLKDLQILLEQTEGKGINVYTHGEMLPALAYPELKKYAHLAGHFGTAWQNQQKEFDNIPAAFLFTTNCIQKPRESYIDNVFTTGLVSWPGVAHIHEENGQKDFTPVIEKALELGGFDKDKLDADTMTGFGRNAVLGVADKVIGAVKSGLIKHFFLVGGCDGAKPGRNYYTEFVQKVPKDTIILTLACGKFRFNTLDLGKIGGLPRILDMGQCNDAYSAIQVAVALADAFECGVNDLPLSLVLSWYEQKAVVILLTLLSLGIKGIKLGPTLPAFISPNVLNILVEKFAIAPITTPGKDIAQILEGIAI
ncbi:MAG: hydroxylamine reductase [PVC group bacterium]|nr:hydroxylamine reductase [PVC group bacterium]